MTITIEGDAKEIAALALELQGRREPVEFKMDGEKLARAVVSAIHGTDEDKTP